MSTNITSIKVLKCNAKILKKDVERFLKKLDDLPENCFLKELGNDVPDKHGYVKIDPKKFWWCNCWSGNSYNFFIKEVGTKIQGKLEAVIIWENGEFSTGLKIKDGLVSQPEVKIKLE